ncbi:toluene monooxygenase electron transfer component [Noviherbaspirillum humi]|uniref:Toluene monooxygenase electron transfer component n=1 Tax=Noviherbaspirillum humi TaxID=1688639 RepID=A0A239IM97_9BURK|nr:2Fe-2S iron-sulfur cluster-binding protein [Noviherbaspirillum humi]SNS94338.1 toluene monooxygenase electron transfer component [Noviherbaspirillum humi]
MFKIEIADNPNSYECPSDDTLTRAGLRAGLGLSYECNVGSCGSCKVELLSGTVESNWPEAPALSDRDRAKNRILGCQSRPTSDCRIKARVLDQYQPPRRPQKFSATLMRSLQLTPDMREFQFALQAPVDFLPGQYALLYFPGVDGGRAYSMSNIPRADGQWHFQIKRVPGGAGTEALFEKLSEGDTIAIDGPYGQAYLRTDSPRDIVCIGGGSGLAPVISIARGMAATPALAGRKLHFFYGGRRPEDICGEDMLRELPGYGERIFYHPIISMPEREDPAYWAGKVGFVHDLALETIGKALAEHEIYFAGPPAMATAVQRMLIQEKVPQAQVHYDAFY